MRQKGAGDSGKKTSAVKEDDGFIARRSTHVTGPSNADGDTWQETLAGRQLNIVCVQSSNLSWKTFGCVCIVRSHEGDVLT